MQPLEIHQMDFHYHAGQERGEKTLREHLEHAAITGRSIVGLTDHFNKYLPTEIPKGKPIYENSIKGLRDYYNECDALRAMFPTLTLYFAPELGPRTPFEQVPQEAVDMADYFICEPTGVEGTPEENTARLIERVCDIADFSARVSRPVFVAHPFRSPVNARLINRPIEQWMRDIPVRSKLSDYTPTQINEFFLFDVAQFGRAAAANGVPVEINGATQNRVRVANQPGILRLLWAAFALIKEQGVSFVPGSDQHGFSIARHGDYVPSDCFEAIGVTAEDIAFLHEFEQR